MIARDEAIRWTRWVTRHEPGTDFRSLPCAPNVEILLPWGEEQAWRTEWKRTRMRREEVLDREGVHGVAPTNSDPNSVRVFGLALDRTMGDQLLWQETKGFFDRFDRPPWDLWCDYRRCGDPGEWCLLFIAPPPLDAIVERTLIELDVYDCFFEVVC